MQLIVLVVLQGLLLCAAFHHIVKDKVSLKVVKQCSNERDAQLFEQFVRDYNRTYEANEYKHRFDIFRKNLDEIDRRNAEYETPVHGITKFSDWTAEEFQRLLGYRRRQEPRSCTQMSSIPDVSVPAELDYRKQNLVTAVKDQGFCGSCWSFSTTGNIEGQYAKKYKKLESFSEQQLLDCIPNQDCDTGYTIGGAESYVVSAGGIMTEHDYPYEGSQSTCEFDSKKVKAKLSGYEDWSLVLLSAKDENALKKVLVSRGPISVALDGYPVQNYRGGILHGDDCDETEVNHAVLLVGYGTENGTPYWLLKNSWGAGFGENGYFRMQYGIDCLGMMSAELEIINAVIA